MEKVIILYYVVINFITLVAFGLDKRRARLGKWRIPEKTLLGLCALGGAFLGYIAMDLFKHKKKNPKFKFFVPLFLFLHLLFRWYAMR